MNYICAGRSVMQRDKAFYESIGQIQTLVLGDSHNMKVLKTDYCDGLFNFATGGENHIQTYYKLKAILEQAENQVSTIILPFHINSFAKNKFSKKAHLYYWQKYIDYKELGQIEGKPIAYLLESIHGKYFPYLGKMKLIRNYFFAKKLNEEGKLKDKEALNEQFAGETQEEKQKVAEKRFSELFKYGYHDDSLEIYFDKLVELAQAHKLNVVVLTLPLTQSFMDVFLENYQIEWFENKLAAVKVKYPGLNYIDLRQGQLANEIYFSDSDHLNLDGTRMANQMIRERVAGLCPSS